jgi:hypothetical protein
LKGNVLLCLMPEVASLHSKINMHNLRLTEQVHCSGNALASKAGDSGTTFFGIT